MSMAQPTEPLFARALHRALGLSSALRFIAKGKVLERLQSWGEGPEGFFEICLENYEDDFRV